jgi:hypothetical protein
MAQSNGADSVLACAMLARYAYLTDRTVYNTLSFDIMPPESRLRPFEVIGWLDNHGRRVARYIVRKITMPLTTGAPMNLECSRLWSAAYPGDRDAGELL